MLDYLLQRGLLSVVTLAVISLVVFTGVRLIPGDPARVLAGTDADEAGLDEIREKYGLNDPIPVQYLRWVGLALRGDLGESIRTREPVARTVAMKLPITLELACLSLLVALALALPAGVFAALRRNTVWDVLANGVSLCGLSVPNFWLGIMLILLLSVRLGWLPASGFVPLLEDPLGNLRRMLMPAFVLGTGLAAVLMRQTRNSMLEVLSADYIRTAYSKGLRQRAVVLRHAIRNGLIPVVTVLGLQMGALMSGAVVTEQIFVVPGFGRLIVEAVFTRDYPLVQGVVLITASAYVLVNFLVDLSYSLLNPRIRIRGTARGA
ncbi:MAG: peptide ABC transporter [Candidatus Rokubacteria bacterium RIFCSPHIGHO2_12_FULL_73_22]|nr:MAG: peptide ABC transporter [Candidatus Rokubacteria bacterium RIFCSPHIGHO2_02_FULL_73_26]OGL03039.1 MAG: peptide ABC transporter [Candidatus Rokubacteria bacterium RIFCSPHIGHO2_12_FULL_73_22]OGL09440.1 MAG: peptide ABC transporter [Candidatus Rokubacteria bacterium RIFCSPLOWO2_02_FULL_73_56]OGL25163.1 MAG: peptide ABC transporter [Candidatus Rokubacteria bacterium RIFCSPLOWO2_12_FULL_73_47]